MHKTLLKSFASVMIFYCISIAPTFADPEEDATALVNKMFTEASYVAIMTAKRDELKRKIGENIDFSGVSENDFDAFTDLQTELTAEAMTVGLRRAFKKKLLDELSAEDIATLLACHNGTKCDASMFSVNGAAVISGLGKYGQEQGQAIGENVGQALTQKFNKLIKENKDGKFEDPEAVLVVLNGVQ